MQVARIQRPGSRTYGRKLVESLTALFLTLRHGRENVLSHYLRIVPYGNRIHVVDIQTSKVLAWMGSIDYFDEVQSGAIDYASIPRSSGSTLKPFLYGLALDKGVITPASVLDDLPRGSAAITNTDKCRSHPTPKSFIEPRTFVDLPAPYAAWVAKRGLPRKPRLGPATPLSSALSPAPRLAIASPGDGLRLISDPETPKSMATLPLRALVDPASEQVVWYVDGKPLQLVDYPYTARGPSPPASTASRSASLTPISSPTWSRSGSSETKQLTLSSSSVT